MRIIAEQLLAPQRQKAHKDFSKAIPEVLQLGDPTAYGSSAGTAAGPRSALLGFRLLLVAAACGPSLGG
ncbi:MAG: hypothetical protein WAW52_02150 [Methanothrix sp.]